MYGMKIAQAQVVGGQIKSAPLPHEVEPLQLDPAAMAGISELLKAPIGSLSSVATPTPLGAALPQIDWSKLLLVPPSLLGSAARIPLAPTAAAAGKKADSATETSVRVLSASEKLTHGMSIGQSALDVWSTFDPASGMAQHLGEVADVGMAGVALVEIIQQRRRPKPLTGWKKALFYLKRVVFISKAVSDVVPNPASEPLKVVALILKKVDESGEHAYALKFQTQAD